MKRTPAGISLDRELEKVVVKHDLEVSGVLDIRNRMSEGLRQGHAEGRMIAAARVGRDGLEVIVLLPGIVWD